MKSTVAPSLWGIIITGIIGVPVASVIIWARVYRQQEESMPQITLDMSGETRAENTPDVTPSPTQSGTLPEKG